MRVLKRVVLEGLMKKEKRREKRKAGVAAEFRRNKFSYLFLLPAGVYTLIFSYFTIPYMIIAFENFRFDTGIFSQWVGWKNFQFFFQSTKAWEVTRNTLVLNLSYLVVDTLLALVIAILVNEVHKRKFARMTQSVMLFPHFLSWVIVSYVIYAFLSSEYGLINQALQGVGLDRVNWYNNASYWPVILVIVHAIKTAGYNSIVYLAAITGIDSGIYEAAAIDGAGAWKRIFYITLPILMPTVCILTLMSLGRLFFGDFNMYYAIVKDNGILQKTTDVIDTYVFRMLRNTGNPSMAMAVGLYQSVMGFLMVFGANWFTRKFFPEGALF